MLMEIDDAGMACVFPATSVTFFIARSQAPRTLWFRVRSTLCTLALRSVQPRGTATFRPEYSNRRCSSWLAMPVLD